MFDRQAAWCLLTGFGTERGRPRNSYRSALSGTLVALALILALVACDRTMAIRQSNAGANRSPVVIEVKEAHPFIGEKNYAPSISVTNPYDGPISIDRVELHVDQHTYSDKRPRPQDWPVTIAGKRTEQVVPLFDLGDSVWHVFYRKSTELQVYGRYNGEPIQTTATIVGEKLR